MLRLKLTVLFNSQMKFSILKEGVVVEIVEYFILALPLCRTMWFISYYL